MPPVLAITGDKDHVTPARELARYLVQLPDIQNVILPGALHDVLNEADIFRLEAWRNIDRFLERVMRG
jgi:alpha-beta hydrolase superfamily lysophospholipase